MNGDSEQKPRHKFPKGNKYGKGKPPKLVASVLNELAEEGYEPLKSHQIKEVYLQLVTLPEDKLKDIVNDKEVGMIFRIIAKNVLGNKGFEIIERILDRAVGKPKIEGEGNEPKQIIVKFDTGEE